jgi:hypothetical protein
MSLSRISHIDESIPDIDHAVLECAVAKSSHNRLADAGRIRVEGGTKNEAGIEDHQVPALLPPDHFPSLPLSARFGECVRLVRLGAGRVPIVFTEGLAGFLQIRRITIDGCDAAREDHAPDRRRALHGFQNIPGAIHGGRDEFPLRVFDAFDRKGGRRMKNNLTPLHRLIETSFRLKACLEDSKSVGTPLFAIKMLIAHFVPEVSHRGMHGMTLLQQ